MNIFWAYKYIISKYLWLSIQITYKVKILKDLKLLRRVVMGEWFIIVSYIHATMLCYWYAGQDASHGKKIYMARITT